MRTQRKASSCCHLSCRGSKMVHHRNPRFTKRYLFIYLVSNRYFFQNLVSIWYLFLPKVSILIKFLSDNDKCLNLQHHIYINVKILSCSLSKYQLHKLCFRSYVILLVIKCHILLNAGGSIGLFL